MKIKPLFLIFISINVLSQPAERLDKPYEFSSSSKICNYTSYYSKEILLEIMNEAKTGNSQASYFLFFGSKIIKNEELPSADNLLQLMLNNGNPYGLTTKASMLFFNKKYKDGLFYFEKAAELGDISAILSLREIYSSEKYSELMNLPLSLYWWRREALSGNIYYLKQYIHNNPEKLPINELKHWQNAYNILINQDKVEISKKDISTKTKLILFQINENREKAINTLKKHHPWYGNYKYCK
ncbi:MAG: sel1 repeat family protein [Xanthomonadales bacterium]|jgi:TPR repeat protein|nr:sel1 repeat family protein [Xanthomonadales bacterium]